MALQTIAKVRTLNNGLQRNDKKTAAPNDWMNYDG
jgi:hypothetical protein